MVTWILQGHRGPPWTLISSRDTRIHQERQNEPGTLGNLSTVGFSMNPWILQGPWGFPWLWGKLGITWDSGICQGHRGLPGMLEYTRNLGSTRHTDNHQGHGDLPKHQGLPGTLRSIKDSNIHHEYQRLPMTLGYPGTHEYTTDSQGPPGTLGSTRETKIHQV